MLDRDIAKLYEVTNKAIRQAVSRNERRFPEDFMFILSDTEIDELILQKRIPNRGILAGSHPMVFTDLGVAMLSSVLRSERAIDINIEIMRSFRQLRELVNQKFGLAELAERVLKLEKNVGSHNNQIGIIIDTLGQMALDEQEKENKKPLGFPTDKVKPVDPDKPLFPDKK